MPPDEGGALLVLMDWRGLGEVEGEGKREGEEVKREREGS